MSKKNLSPEPGLPTTRRALIVGGASAATALALPTLARAQAAWPTRPVKFYIPLGPGAGVDITARLVADKLSAKWGGQSVVVENKPGGDGIVAMTSFLGAKDDHTLLMSPTSSFTHHPWTNEKMPYDIRDMVAIARMTNTIVGVAVPGTSDFKTFGDLVAYAKANPGKLNWATITGFFDFVFDGFQKKMGLQIEKVPYRNTVQAATDLAEGRIQLMMSAYAILRPHVESGKLRLIAVTASQRASMLKDVPTTPRLGAEFNYASGDGDHTRGWKLTAKDQDALQTVLIGHHDVHNHDVGRLLPVLVQPLFPITGLLHRISSLL